MSTGIHPRDIETHLALRNGAEALQRMREAIERAAQEIARYEVQFQEATDLGQKAKVLNWAINHLCTSIMPNRPPHAGARPTSSVPTPQSRAQTE